ncbi:signal peptidase I [Rhinocladiella mackenziei CBS 650.93]|uniref:Mitochondrial inner membrane protease subunit n=1 Tax=Rhinocladiella mackenziei CBS 650.93 TaxID=1442369 RepID=A0A0D2HDB5_9EURO|nr:signal peptidase I [Rhinocladiella mackenziei CBS 650.93]KIX08473.1 signal peptidase I [Rhinocladiella mackenziei CBS 650.93]
MSPWPRVFGRAPTRPSKTPVASLIQVGLGCVAIYSATVLIAHNVVWCGPNSGPSMFPTISGGLTYSIYSRLHRRGNNVKVGDVVLFENPVFLRGRACKRIIGMPGDYVVHDPSLSPTVGGAPVPGITDVDAVREEPAMVQVPEGHVWVAGDNLSHSRDSRFYGPVPMALIAAKVLYNGDGWFNWTSLRSPQLQPVSTT